LSACLIPAVGIYHLSAAHVGDQGLVNTFFLFTCLAFRTGMYIAQPARRIRPLNVLYPALAPS